MKPKKACFGSEEEMAASLWWWRHSRFARPRQPWEPLTPYTPNEAEWRNWKSDGMERVARGWELIRRVFPDLQWVPFYDLDGAMMVNLRARIIPHEERHQYATMITTAANPKGWTEPGPEGYRVNLRQTKGALRAHYLLTFLPTAKELNEALASPLPPEESMATLKAKQTQRRRDSPPIVEHLRWVEAQAKAQGSTLPEGMSGQRNRPLSWAYVEVLDIARYFVTRDNFWRKFSGVERKTKTAAKKAAKELLPDYKTALEDMARLGITNAPRSAEEISRDRRRILGTWVPPKTYW